MSSFPFGLLFLALAPLSLAQEPESEPEAEPESKLNSQTLSGMGFRSIGPAFMSGRIADLAIDRERPNIWYVAVGSGGLWKTVNAGTTFEPIFDGESSYSIGCVTIDPSDRDTIWVGTGEAVGGRHVGYGDGVYVSHDGGGSFRNVGLPESEHVAKILVDPRDSSVIYVAAQGPLWSKGGERGLYKTTDGGESWTQVLSAGPWTGVTDVAIDPRDSHVLYAATHQRHRTVWGLINGGPESGIHKSTDGGATWVELENGLPSEDMGKIALAVSPQRPDVVYATIELAARGGGTWRSENGGSSWTKVSDYVSGGTGPHYYQELWVDPHRFGVLYQANVVLGRSEDGGETWQGVGKRSKHVDNHAVAFHPTDPDFLLVGCDGGLYRSFDRGATYDFFGNLPLTQFYKVDVDYDWPVYHVIGGTQDNATQHGPARTLSRNGIRNSDWRLTIDGDGHDNAIDPTDPNVIYGESQQGYLQRYDRRTGETVDIRPQPGPGEENLRFNWDSPVLISPHSHTRIYFGSKKLHRSDDRGDTWTAISGDLSRGQDRLLLPHMDRVWSVDALWDLWAMSEYGNITSISESPLVEGLIYVGTDDGLIQITEDGGASWRTVDGVPSAPELAFVNDVKADRHDPDAVYVCLDSHKTGDFAPYVFKSTDRGRTWSSIAADLPERHIVWRIEQDHVVPELLFLGTEFGIFTSLDGGVEWTELSGGVPTISFRDLAIQRRENDLVGASFGRSFYVLDDYSPLRALSTELLEEREFLLFPPREAWLYVPADHLGGPVGNQGDRFFSAPNPPFGAVLTYYLRDGYETLADTRREAENERKEAGEDNPYPGFEALAAEEREVEPAILFEVRDAGGGVVDRFEGPTSAGIHRVNWELRYAPFTEEAGRGPLVTPGTYTVQAYERVRDVTRPLGEPQVIAVRAIGEPALEPQDRAATLAFQMELGGLQQSLVAARKSLEDALEEVRAVQGLLRGGKVSDLALLDRARGLELELQDAVETLTGDPLPERHGASGMPSISGRLQSVLYGTLGSTYGPTNTQREQVGIARSELDSALVAVRSLLEVSLPALRTELDAAGVPWTPGRPIPAPSNSR
jgi:photosystem II stability/assembly factor-like uncharacterized protein